MGAVVETPPIYLDMTAEENLRQQYLVLGLPSTDGVPELLHLVGLDGTGKKKAKNFSLGMRQRLGIAVALAGGPDFLVLARVLDRLGAEYRVVDDTRTDVFADVEATRLVAEAMKENCVIHSMKERDESLESFYMNLMGGAHRFCPFCTRHSSVFSWAWNIRMARCAPCTSSPWTRCPPGRLSCWPIRS